jgi:polyisoprenoid-binding protein YceI
MVGWGFAEHGLRVARTATVRKDQAMNAKERWEIDASNSELAFSLRHIVISEIAGVFRSWGGEMFLDPDDLTKTRIDVWIDVASIDTGSVERDAHVRSAEFLDVEKFPRASFTSERIVVRRDDKAAASGRLRLHGISQDIDLDVAAQRTWIDRDGVRRATYLVGAKLNRQVFGLHWNQDLDVGGFVVGDKVEIRARVEMVRRGEADFARDDGPHAGDALAQHA